MLLIDLYTNIFKISYFELFVILWGFNHDGTLCCKTTLFEHCVLVCAVHLAYQAHLGWGSVAAKITANVWGIVQLSNLVTPLLYNGV